MKRQLAPKRASSRGGDADFVAVVGPGALGGVLAASLLRTGRRVVLIRRNGRGLRRLAREGLSFTSLAGRARLLRGLEFAGGAAPGGTCEALFLCVKSKDLACALRGAAPLAGPETAVVSLLNGVDHARPILRAFGPDRTVLGSCYFAALRTSARSVRHTGEGPVLLARSKGNSRALSAAARLLREAGWTVRAAPSARRLLWTKAAFNAALNPVGALAAKTNGELAESAALRGLLDAAGREAFSLMRAQGIEPLTRSPERSLLQGCRRAPDQVNSMAQDLAAGRPTEARDILGPFLRAARRTGRKAPVLSMLLRIMRRVEKELVS